MTHEYDDPVQFIPVNQINVVNTRSRGKEKFREIVSSIKKLGLKKPITVCPASGEYGPGDYDLVVFDVLGEAWRLTHGSKAVVIGSSFLVWIITSLIQNVVFFPLSFVVWILMLFVDQVSGDEFGHGHVAQVMHRRL